MLSAVDFAVLKLYAETKMDLTSSFTMEYTYDCSQIENSKKVGGSCTWVYIVVFVVLSAYNCFKYYGIDE